jgi:hypothetical protein
VFITISYSYVPDTVTCCNSERTHFITTVFCLTLSCIYSSISITRSSRSHITTDGQTASLSWRQTPIWGQRPISLYLSLNIL